jgi:hypothetical protein
MPGLLAYLIGYCEAALRDATPQIRPLSNCPGCGAGSMSIVVRNQHLVRCLVCGLPAVIRLAESPQQ